MGYHAKFGKSALSSINVNVGLAHFFCGVRSVPKNLCLPWMYYYAKFVKVKLSEFCERT